jgi:hypothetical protein
MKNKAMRKKYVEIEEDLFVDVEDSLSDPARAKQIVASCRKTAKALSEEARCYRNTAQWVLRWTLPTKLNQETEEGA